MQLGYRMYSMIYYLNISIPYPCLFILFTPQCIFKVYIIRHLLSLDYAFNLHFTLRVLELFVFCPPLNVAVHSKAWLWSVEVGWKVKVDVASHWPLFSLFDWKLGIPERLQVKWGGLVGQEWVTEQEADTVSPTFITSFKEKDTGSGEPVN